jgi:hypothetical protein
MALFMLQSVIFPDFLRSPAGSASDYPLLGQSEQPVSLASLFFARPIK